MGADATTIVGGPSGGTTTFSTDATTATTDGASSLTTTTGASNNAEALCDFDVVSGPRSAGTDTSRLCLPTQTLLGPYPHPSQARYDEYDPHGFHRPRELDSYHRSSGLSRRPRVERDDHLANDVLAHRSRRHPLDPEPPSRSRRRREVGLHVPGKDETIYPGDSIIDDGDDSYYRRRPPAHVPADEIERFERRRRQAEREAWTASDAYALDSRRSRQPADIFRDDAAGDRYSGDAYYFGRSPVRDERQHPAAYVEDDRHRAAYERDPYEFDAMREALSERYARPDPYAPSRWSPDGRSRSERPPPLVDPARQYYRGWSHEEEGYVDERRGLSWRDDYWPQPQFRNGRGLGPWEAEDEWEVRRRWEADSVGRRPPESLSGDRRPYPDPYDGESYYAR
jgi:hypothetical protein